MSDSDYKDEHGGSHRNEQERQAANAKIHEDNFAGQASKGFLWILLFAPALIAKAVAFLFSLLGRLGIVGKILQTAFVLVIAGPVLALIVVGSTGAGSIMPSFVQNAILAAFMLFSAAGYFLWHYDTVQEMDTSEFSTVIKNACSFMWLGGIAAVIIGFFKGSPGVRLFLTIASIAGGIIYYIVQTRPYAKEAARNGSNIPTAVKAIVMLAALGVVVVITVIGGIAWAAKEAEYAAEFAKKVEENPVLAIVQHKTPFEATITADSQGVITGMNPTYVDIRAGSTVTVRDFGQAGLDYEAYITFNGQKMVFRQLELIKPLE